MIDFEPREIDRLRDQVSRLKEAAVDPLTDVPYATIVDNARTELTQLRVENLRLRLEKQRLLDALRRLYSGASELVNIVDNEES